MNLSYYMPNNRTRRQEETSARNPYPPHNFHCCLHHHHRIAIRSIVRVDADSTFPAPTQQDRKITPAGKLILDASNGLPAVAPLTMNFVRTPDTQGPDGKGRYLIAVNSGWGMQFNSRSNSEPIAFGDRSQQNARAAGRREHLFSRTAKRKCRDRV